MTERDIHKWWPYLSIAAKAAVDEILDDPEARLPAMVRGEIEQITGAPIPDDRRLTDRERDFIRTQKERVD